MAIRVLAFAGSTRSGSFNKRFLKLGAAAVREAGAEVTEIDLRDFPMPLYDGDLEEREGVPEHGRRLKRLMREHPAFLLCCPEYNSSIPGVLKNAIDWASRQEEGEEPLVCFSGKTAGLLSASPGALGGMRCLVHVRSILTNIGALVIPEQVSLSRAHQAFDEGGALKEERTRQRLADFSASLVRIASRLQ